MQKQTLRESQCDLKTNQYTQQKQQSRQVRQLYQINSEEDEIPERPKINMQSHPNQIILAIQSQMNIKKQSNNNNLNELNGLNPEIEPKDHQKNIQINQILPIIIEQPENIIQNTPRKQCDFCAELLEQQKFEKAFKCEHIFCQNCLKTYLQTQIYNFKIIACPSESCIQVVNQQGKYFKSLSNQLKQKYQVIKFRKNLQKNQNCMICPDQKCKKGYIQFKKDQKTGNCKQCKVEYCLNCKIKSHAGKCQSFQQILLKDKFKYKRCFGCKSVVERNQGCPHMTCKCGSQFCYYCGRQWQSPHRCLRHIAGGQLVTDKLSKRLSCLRNQDLEYSYTILGFLSKIPYYIVSFLILIVYLSWCVAALLLLVVLALIASFFAGYIAIMYKLCKDGGCCAKVVFILLILFLPIGFLVGWFFAFGAGMCQTFPKYLELALSAKLFPFCLL